MSEIAQLLTRLTGIDLSRGGLRSSLERFVDQRAQELGLRGVEEYYALVLRGDRDEQQRLFDVVGVPHTWFFRDAALLDVADQVVRQATDRRRPVDVWIAGCATGEDAYSLSMMLQDLGRNVRITATDISARSLELARAARYGAHSVRELPHQYAAYLRRTKDSWTVIEPVRELVSFQHHNLMDEPLGRQGGWDLILCRNVLIYFSSETTAACVERLAKGLRRGGTLLLGPGEHLESPPPSLRPVMIGQRLAFVHEDAPHRVVARPSLRRAPENREADRSRQPQPQSQPQPQRSKTLSPRATVAPEKPSSVREADPRARLLHQSDIGHAIDELLESSARDPLDAELRMLAGIALYTARDYRLALSHLRAALLLDDRLWPAALYQGLCLDSMGDPLRARAEYRHAASLVETGIADQVPLPGALEGFATELVAMVRTKARAL